jgi:hypothetical protein
VEGGEGRWGQLLSPPLNHHQRGRSRTSNPSGIYTETQYCLRQWAALALLQVGQHGATARCGNTGIVTRVRGTG